MKNILTGLCAILLFLVGTNVYADTLVELLSGSGFTVQGSANNTILSARDSGSVGIGTTSPWAQFTVKANSIGYPVVFQNLDGNNVHAFYIGENGDGEFIMGSGNSIILRSGGASYINGGNVGIGTTNPGAKLDVAGGFSISADSGETAYHTGLQRVGGQSVLWYGGGTSNLFIKSGATGGGGDRVVITQNGNVGIGNMSPAEALHVEGNIRVGYGDHCNNYIIHAPGNGNLYFGRSYYNNCTWSNHWAYINNGNFVSVSTREAKENICDLTSEEAKEVVMNLSPKKYNYKDGDYENYLGFIAEDVPDLVAMNDRKGLVTMDIVAVVTKVVQEQQNTIQQQQTQIKNLKKANDLLNNEVAQLKNELLALSSQQDAIESILIALSTELPKEKLAKLHNVKNKLEQ